jgi:hypothetical protein
MFLFMSGAKPSFFWINFLFFSDNGGEVLLPLHPQKQAVELMQNPNIFGSIEIRLENKGRIP